MKQYTILHTEAATGWSGQQIRTLDELSGMSKRGHRVMLICPPGSSIAEKAHERGIPALRLRMGGAFDIAGIRKLRAFFRQQRPDIVNTHSSRDSWTALIAATLAGDIVKIRTRHHSAPIKKTFETRLLYCRLSDAIVTTGESVRKYVIERTGANPENVMSIPTGIDLNVFDCEKADGNLFRKDIGVAEGAPLIGTVGMLMSMKGHSYFIEAAAEVIRHVPEAKFVIVGGEVSGSDLKERLVERISELGIKSNVIFAGYRSDIQNVMAGLDVFVLASIRSEGVPQVITQAMAMKRPVIGTNVGSVYEQIIDKETGFLIEKANSAQIRDSILTLLKNPAMAKEMGEKGRKLVEERFSLEVMLDKTEALYARLMSS